MLKVDVCIVGAGPAGSALSHFLHKLNIDHLLIDKSKFPRDKICGDGITVDVLNVLKRIDPDLMVRFTEQAEMLPSWGYCFHGTKGKEYRVDLKDSGMVYPPFYTSKRLDLDDFLIRELPKNGSGQFWSETELVKLDRVEKGFHLELKNAEGEVHKVESRFIIGAEGEKPVVTRFLGLDHYREKEHLIAAIRIYYENIQGFHPNNHLEFFFDKSLLPGYFWAFPLAENQANTGLGMVSTGIARNKLNLKKTFQRLIETNPLIGSYFDGAISLEKTKGWGLPTMTSKRIIGGDGYALIGDAGGMIEPFTGKGIGPGMMSARIASEHIAEALRNGTSDLSSYNDHIYRYYKTEIRIGYTLQKSLRFPIILNQVINLAAWAPVKKYGRDKIIRDFTRWT